MNVLHHQPWVEESLEVKLPTIWTDRRGGKSRRREEKKREDQRKSQKKEGAPKGRKVVIHSVFPMICDLWLRRVEK
jgi:hypothetical protein